VEQGFRDFAFSEWFGFYLPAKASDEVVQNANKAIRAALSAPGVAEGLAPFGLEGAPSSPEALVRVLKADTERWGPIVKTVGFTADN
jgi:tripartite-type tricarboxylate transporter receptor subunit TctC